MKHLFSAIAVAALMGSVPAWAQTSASDASKQPMPQASSSDEAGSSAAGTSSESATGKVHHRTAARGGRASEDNMAEELNRQELDRVTRNGGDASGGGAPSNGMSGTSAPAASGATGAMPNTPHTGAEAGSKEQGNPSPAQTEERPGASSKD